jgi:hypothetical protein
MCIQWQVKREQVDVVFYQAAYTLTLVPGYRLGFALPEVAMMNNQGIGALLDRRFDQGLARGHAADNMSDFRIRLDLQSVRTIVIKFIDFQVLVAKLAEFS